MKILSSNYSIISKYRTRPIKKIKLLGLRGLLNNEEINYWENLGKFPESLVYYLTLSFPSLLRAVKAAATVDRPDLLDTDPERCCGQKEHSPPLPPASGFLR